MLRARMPVDAVIEHMKLKFMRDMPVLLAHEALRGKQVLLVLSMSTLMGAAFGSVTVRGLRCTPFTRNS